MFIKCFLRSQVVPFLGYQQQIDFAKTDQKTDRELGIDYTVRPVIKGDGFLILDESQKNKIYNIDLKSPNGAHGGVKNDQDFYHNSAVSYTLFKKINKDGRSFFINGNYYKSKATHNCYIVANTKETDDEIAAMKENESPTLLNAHMYFINNNVMHKFVDKHILGHPFVKKIINEYKNNNFNLDKFIDESHTQGFKLRKSPRFNNVYSLLIPIPGTDKEATIALKTYNYQGTKADIRMYISTDMFKHPYFSKRVFQQGFKFHENFKLNEMK